MKVYIAITIGSEVNGKNMLVRVDKASSTKEKIDEFIKLNPTTWIEKYTFQEGSLDCYFQRQPYEIEGENE